MMKRVFFASSSFFLLFPLEARPPEESICGTERGQVESEVFLHRQSMRNRGKGLWRAAAAVTPAQAAGNIVVVEDSDGVVARQNLFSLEQRTLTFQPASQGRYTFTTSGGTYDAALAGAGTELDLGDDDSRRIALPFAFPYFGRTYRDAFVNSDGNLTFDEGDSAIAARSLGRFAAGPPRIALLFNDLDPSRAGTVSVNSNAERLIVSWRDVPEYSDFGTGPLHRMQMRIYPNGRIEFAYDQARPTEGVTGITPGRLQNGLAVVSFTTGATQEFAGGVAERYGNNEALDNVRVAQKFYESFEDSYDYLVVYNRVGLPPASGALATETTVRSFRRGIGDVSFDNGRIYGSPSRLQAFLNMGPLSQYPSDPYGIVGLRGRITGDTTMSVLGHEAGHLFLALASIRDPNNPRARPMLGAQQAHWSFNFNSEASLLEGNRWADDGAGVLPRFRSVATVEQYSPLDQYLMGLRAPSEVPSTFLIRGSGILDSAFPQVGRTASGERQEIRVEEVIAAEGRRVPDHTVAQRRFRFAFIVVNPAGFPVPEDELAKLDRFRQEFETYFARVSDGRAVAETTLQKSALLSLAPAGGLVSGRSSAATLTLAAPAARAVVFRLEAQGGNAEIPPSVTVAAGQAIGRFELRGISPGNFTLRAIPDDASYSSAEARMVVAPAVASLSVAGPREGLPVATPEAQRIEIPVRVVDENDVPYAGIAVQAQANGSLSPTSARTDESGVARFQWTTTTGPVRLFSASLEEAPSRTVEVPMLAAPFFSADAVVNAASFERGIAPGAFATIFGFNLWAGLTTVAPPPSPGWPTTLDAVRVTVNGAPAPILLLSLRQMNIQVPASITEGPAEIEITNPFGRSETITVNARSVQPGVFFNGANNQTAAIQRGRFVEVYGTGFNTAVAPVEAELNGQPVPVVFAGPQSQFPGLFQVNLELPQNLAPGTYPLRLRSRGLESNRTNLVVAPF